MLEQNQFIIQPNINETINYSRMRMNELNEIF